MTGLPPEGYVPPSYGGDQSQPPGGYPPQPPQQPENSYGQGYQPYVPGQSPPPPLPPQSQNSYGRNQYSGSGENNAAKYAFYFGLGVFLCGVLSGIPALIFGIIGLKKSKDLGGEGKGKAITGICLGTFNLVATIIFVTLSATGSLNFSASTTSGSSDAGSAVMVGDVGLTNSNVEITNDAVAIYTAQLENKTDSDSAFSVAIECEGGGETKSSTVETDVLSPGETTEIRSELQFSANNTYLSVLCNVKSLNFL